jgi:hypothetical protein
MAAPNFRAMATWFVIMVAVVRNKSKRKSKKGKKSRLQREEKLG